MTKTVNIITHDVNSFVVDFRIYLTYGLRDRFVNFVRSVFTNHNKHHKEIAALTEGVLV